MSFFFGDQRDKSFRQKKKYQQEQKRKQVFQQKVNTSILEVKTNNSGQGNPWYDYFSLEIDVIRVSGGKKKHSGLIKLNSSNSGSNSALTIFIVRIDND